MFNEYETNAKQSVNEMQEHLGYAQSRHTGQNSEQKMDKLAKEMKNKKSNSNLATLQKEIDQIKKQKQVIQANLDKLSGLNGTNIN